MKHIQIKGNQIARINLNGEHYASNDRCAHMNASFSKAATRKVQGKDIVTCPLHFRIFSYHNRKKLSGPKLSRPVDMTAFPKALQETLAQAGQVIAFVTTYDIETFQVERDGEDIKLKTNS